MKNAIRHWMALAVLTPLCAAACASDADVADGSGTVVVTQEQRFNYLTWKIEGAGGTWHYEIESAVPGASPQHAEAGTPSTGFNSAIDRAGHDWIANDCSGDTGGGAPEWRGWPNFGADGFGHPCRGGLGSSRWLNAAGIPMEFTGRLEGGHLILESWNDTYRVRYHIFPSHASLEVLQADEPYAFLFEGPVAGELNVEQQRYVLGDGRPRAFAFNEELPGLLGHLDFERNFPSDFFYFTDPAAEQVLYIGATGQSEGGDEGWAQPRNMVIFSFGRENDVRALTGTGARSVFGFLDSDLGHEGIASFITARLANNPNPNPNPPAPTPDPPSPNPNPSAQPPITRDGVRLMRAGKQWKFAGMNADAWGLNSCRALPDYPEPNYMTDANLDQYFRELNPNSVTRIWPYRGAPNIPLLDRIITAAERHGQYLAPAFFDGNDNGTQCGSMRYGNAPANLEHIRPIIERYATDTGARKTNSIAFWEISNEISIVRNTDWYNAMAAGIKKMDPKTLIGTGASPYKGSVNTGASLTTAHRSNDIDLISIHEYDNGCNVSHQASIAIEAARNLEKPWYSGESGGWDDYNGGSGMGECLEREWKAYIDAPEGAGMLYWNFQMQPRGARAFAGNTATFIGGSNVLWDAAKSFRHQYQGN